MPAVPAAGTPESTPLGALKLTPEGNVPDSLRVGVGEPVAVTVNDPAEPAIKVALPGLVIAGGLTCPEADFAKLRSSKTNESEAARRQEGPDKRDPSMSRALRRTPTDPVSKCKLGPWQGRASASHAADTEGHLSCQLG